MRKRKQKILKCSLCLEQREVRSDSIAKHCLKCAAIVRNTTHGMTNIRLHRIWNQMRSRCIHKYDNNFYRYGGRGITINNEWLENFIVFYDWALENGYKDNLSIDRINNDGNYEPSNCRWVEQNIQARNTIKLRKSNTSGYRGVVKAVSNSRSLYRSQITVDSKVISLGTFASKKEAGYYYDRFVMQNNLEHTKNFNNDEYKEFEKRFKNKRKYYNFKSKIFTCDEASEICEAYATGKFTKKEISKYTKMGVQGLSKIIKESRL